MYVIKSATDDNYITIERRSFNNPDYDESWVKLITKADVNTDGKYGSFLGYIDKSASKTMDEKASKYSPDPNKKMLRIFRIRNVSNKNKETGQDEVNKQIMWIDPKNYNHERGWFYINTIGSTDHSSFIVKFIEKTSYLGKPLQKMIEIYPDNRVLNSKPWTDLIEDPKLKKPVKPVPILTQGKRTESVKSSAKVTFARSGGKKRCKTKRKRKK